jgi:hypothetical protein
VEVVPEAGQRDLGGLDRTACDRRALEDENLPSLAERCTAAASPLTPAPMTTASYCMPAVSLHAGRSFKPK